MIELTEAAQRRISEIRAAENVPAKLNLRIKVVTGGCAGFTYDMYFDEPDADDRTARAGKETVIIDPMSLPYLEGTKLGYEDPRGFTFDNPRAKTQCKCGASFRTFIT